MSLKERGTMEGGVIIHASEGLVMPRVHGSLFSKCQG